MSVGVDHFIKANNAGKIKRERATSQSQFSQTQTQTLGEQEEPFEELVKLILETKESVLLDLLESSFATNKMLGYVCALVEGLQILNENVDLLDRIKLLRFQFVEKVIQLLPPHQLPTQTLTSLKSSLGPFLDSLTAAESVELCEQILTTLKENPSHFQGCLFFPPLVYLITHQSESVRFAFDAPTLNPSVYKRKRQAEAAIMSPTTFREKFLQVLLSLEWDSAVAVPFCEMFRDIDGLSDVELATIVQKLRKVWVNLELQEVPGAVQNLLLLTTKKNKGCKSLILQEIVSFFDSNPPNVSEENENEFKEVQGTAALTMNFAVKQDQNIGKQYFAHLKKTSPSLSPFLLGFLLSLAQIKSFHQHALDMIRSFLAKSSSVSGRVVGSPWLSEFVEPVASVSPEKNREIFRKILTGGAHGWDHILRSVIDLGISLVGSEKRVVRQDVTNLIDLGCFLLLETFRSHEHVQEKILSYLTTCVIENGEHMDRFLVLLGQIVKEVPQDVRCHLFQVKQTFDLFHQLPQETAISLLRAVIPLVCIDADFQNYVIKVLRKALFDKSESVRFSAAEGYLSILEALCKQDPTSSTQRSQSSTQRPPSFDGVFIEILGILRRCTSHQRKIRRHLYRRMASICQFIPKSLYPPFFLILYSQLGKYYPDGGPLDIYRAIDGGQLLKGAKSELQEPLGDLIQCIGQCVSLACENTEEIERLQVVPIHFKLEKKINSLLEYLLTADPQSLKAPPVLPKEPSPKAIKEYRTAAATLLGSIYTAAMESVIVLRPADEKTLPNVFRYFSHFHTLPNNSSPSQPCSEVTQAPTARSGTGTSRSARSGVKKKKLPPKPPQSLPFVLALSVPVIDFTLTNYNDQLQEIVQVNTTQGLAPRGKDFLRFLILNCQHIYGKKAKEEMSRIESPLESIQTICKFFVEQFKDDWDMVRSSKTASLACSCLETYIEILEYFRLRGSESDVLFLLSVLEKSGEKKTISELMPSVLKLLSDVSKKNFIRESGVVLKLLHFMVDQMSHSELKEYALDSKAEPHFSELLSQPLATSIVKKYVAFLKKLIYFCEDLMEKILDSLLNVLNSIYQDLPEEEIPENEFPMIESGNEGLSFASMMAASLEKLLDEADFSIGLLLEKKDGEGEARIQQQELLCDRLLTIQTWVSKLTTCGAGGFAADAVFKLLNKFFRVQTNLAKTLTTFASHKNVCSKITEVLKEALKLGKNEAVDFIEFAIPALDPGEQRPEGEKKREKDLAPQLKNLVEIYHLAVLKLADKARLEVNLPRLRAFALIIRKRKRADREDEGEEEEVVEEEGGEEEEGGGEGGEGEGEGGKEGGELPKKRRKKA